MVTTGPSVSRWSVRDLGSRLVALIAVTSFGVVGAAFALSVGGPAPTASADPVGACSTTTGVVVAVDFGPFGGQVQAGCDPTATTALNALEVAGFTPTGTSQYGLAFVCLIDGDPTNQSCTSTPPASASWSFWLADSGTDRWTYSTAGASTLEPEPGSVEAWTFGDSSPGDKPDFTPAKVRKAGSGSPSTTSPTGVSPDTTAPTGNGGTTPATPRTRQAGSPSGNPAAHTGGPARGSPGTVVTTTTTPESSAPVTGGAAATTTGGSAQHGSAAPAVVAASPDASDHQGTTGSPLPLVIAIVAVVVLGGWAGIVAWRRRRAA